MKIVLTISKVEKKYWAALEQALEAQKDRALSTYNYHRYNRVTFALSEWRKL